MLSNRENSCRTVEQRADKTDDVVPAKSDSISTVSGDIRNDVYVTVERGEFEKGIGNVFWLEKYYNKAINLVYLV